MTNIIIMGCGDRKVHFQSIFMLKCVLSMLEYSKVLVFTLCPRAGLFTNKLSTSRYALLQAILSLFSWPVLDRTRNHKMYQHNTCRQHRPQQNPGVRSPVVVGSLDVQDSEDCLAFLTSHSGDPTFRQVLYDKR